MIKMVHEWGSIWPSKLSSLIRSRRCSRTTFREATRNPSLRWGLRNAWAVLDLLAMLTENRMLNDFDFLFYIAILFTLISQCTKPSSKLAHQNEKNKNEEINNWNIALPQEKHTPLKTFNLNTVEETCKAETIMKLKHRKVSQVVDLIDLASSFFNVFLNMYSRIAHQSKSAPYLIDSRSTTVQKSVTNWS